MWSASSHFERTKAVYEAACGRTPLAANDEPEASVVSIRTARRERVASIETGE
jgi:hypothetical protein